MRSSIELLAQALTTVRSEDRLELARWSTGNALLVGAVITAGALYAVSWMYRREGRGQLGPRLRWCLIACRAAVLVLLGLIGLEPVVARYIHRRVDGQTLVLVDRSASMSLRDHYRLPEDAARVEAVMGSIPEEGLARVRVTEAVAGARDARLIRSLAERNRVRLFEFSDSVWPVPIGASRAEAAGALDGAKSVATSREAEDERSQPDPIGLAEGAPPRGGARGSGSATNIGLAVRGALDAVAGSPVAAVVLLTDGGFNEGEDPGVVGRFLKQKGIRLYAVGTGDPSPPVNVRVVDVSAPRTAFKNDPFMVTVRVETEGVEDDAVRIELLERRGESASPGEVVETRVVPVRPDGRALVATFERKVSEPGVVRYSARVPALKYEAVQSDNQRDVLPAVRVLDDKMKVLLVAGAPSYDYRFLTRAWERDASVELSTWLQSADQAAVREGDQIITELPDEPEELAQYDAVVLIDPNPEGLDPTWASLLANFVSEQGGGVLYEAGSKFGGAFFRSPKTTSLVELLPIVPDPDAEILLNDLGQYQTRSWPLFIPDEALGDPVMRLSDDLVENRFIWAGLDGAYWHFPVRREKPIATVLARHTNPRMANSFGPHVLIATQLVGSGRTAFLGLNSTWRWRGEDEKLFDRFWMQMLRFLVEGKLLGGRSRAMVLTTKDRYEVGESIVVTARALDERFNPLVAPELTLRIEQASPPARGEAGDDSPIGREELPGRLESSAVKPDESDASVDEDGRSEDSEESSIRTRAGELVRTEVLTPIPGREGYYQGRFIADRSGPCRLTLSLPGRVSGERGDSFDREIVVSAPDIEMKSPAMRRDALREFAESTGGAYFDIDEALTVAGLIPDRSLTPPPIRERPRPLWDNAYVFAALIAVLTVEWILRKKAKLL